MGDGREERETERPRLVVDLGTSFWSSGARSVFPDDGVEAWLFVMPPLTEACRSLTRCF